MSTETNNPGAKTGERLEALWQTERGGRSDWLDEIQRDALQVFNRNGFPTTALEDWRYTDVQPVATNYPDWLQNTPAPAAALPELPEIPDAARIVFIDGQYRPELSDADKLPAGAFAGPLMELAAANPQLAERLGTLASTQQSGLIAVNTAFTSDAFGLLLQPDEALDQPLHLVFHTATAELTVQPRLLISLGARSRAMLIEHYSSSGAAIINNVTEIFCGAGAKLIRDRLQSEHHDAWHIAAQYARLEENATLLNTQIDVGAQLARSELQVELAGRSAHTDARGLFMADERRHVDSRITVEHAAPDTTSRERYRGILADRARGVFNGRILVQQDAQKTSADLTNRNLLLSPGAEIDTKPELEIYADDVKCAHGSTTGQLDSNALFYLLSRGIAADEARNMLVRAFAAELVSDIDVPALAGAVQAALADLGKTS